MKKKLSKWDRERKQRDVENAVRKRVADKVYASIAKTEQSLLALADTHRGPTAPSKRDFKLESNQLGWLADAARLLRRVRDSR